MTPEDLLRHGDEAALWSQGCGLEVPEAYQRALAVRRLRMQRGEQPRGYKVGFTNRLIWQRYGVHQPIWGTVWDTSLAFAEVEGELPLQGSCQPRLEPECVFGLRTAPAPECSLDQLYDCVDWIAPGFEVVQSHLKDWKFTAADTVADGALHAALLVGRKVPRASLPAEAAVLEEQLAAARVQLRCDGQPVDDGVGANVLDGPLHALLHFVQALRAEPGAPELLPGDLVTTGTWTDAWPVHAGETWRAEFGRPLSPLEVRFT